MTPSPWWYRRRDLVLGLIYAVSIYAGWGLWWVVTRRPYEWSFVILGKYLGPHGAWWLLGTSALLAIACFLLRAWGSSYLSARVVWSPNARTDQLLIAGPFRFTRNPLYLGNLLLAFAVGPIGTPPAFAMIVIGNVVFLWMLIHFEETGLRKRYGAAFDECCKKVPVLLPRITPVAQRGDVRPSLLQGLRAEIFTGAIALGMIAILIWQNRGLPIFLILWIGGWIVQTILVRTERRGTAS